MKKNIPEHNQDVNEKFILSNEGDSIENIIKKGVVYIVYLCLAVPNWKVSLAKSTQIPPLLKSPLIIIVCMSATRAVEIIRDECKPFSALCKIGKLFAKHFSIEEQRSYLENNEVRIVIGTPHRLYSLFSENSLFSEQLMLVIFDLQKDEKGRTLLESNDTSKDTIRLFSKYLSPVLSETSSLCLFERI